MYKSASKIAVIGAGLTAATLALSPALSTVSSAFGGTDMPQTKVSLKMLGSIGSFTPVTRDERLAKAYERAARESQSRTFRFTPTAGSTTGERSLTVLVRAPEGGSAQRGQGNLGIAPVAFNLGGTKGLARFADESGLPDKDLSPIIEATQMPTANFVLKTKPGRFSANLQLEPRSPAAAAPTSNVPATLGSEKSYTVDLSSSYSLTKHLDVQAGVRYRGPDNRLVPLTDKQQDSQAVYVGTTFKF